MEYVFGYGSLAEAERAVVVHAHGMRRTWDVAMDNGATLPGYKYYVDPVSGARPDAFVTFLNLAAGDGAVNGVLLGPLDAAALAALDARERNYTRVDLTDRIAEAVDGVVWGYQGSDAALARYRRGAAAGNAVVDAGYLSVVEAGFRALGAVAYAEFVASTDPPACPVLPLLRIDL